MLQASERERLPHTIKIDPRTARLATIHVPSRLDQFDGLLPDEDVEAVIVLGKGRFSGRIMVQVGTCERSGLGPRGIVYRQEVTYEGYRRGRDVAIDPNELREGIVASLPSKRGLWVPLEKLGTLKEAIVNEA